MDSIIFICTGNTCRSPMAEGIFNKTAKEEGLNMIATSAGLWAADGMAVSPNSVEAVKQYGIDIGDHVSRPLSLDDIMRADLILTMTEGHKMQLMQALDDKVDVGEKIYTLKEYVNEENINISDPFGMDIDTYIATAEEINDSVEKLIKILIKRNN